MKRHDAACKKLQRKPQAVLTTLQDENDNKAAVSAIVGGGITKTLRHARRTHGLSAAFLSDYYQKHKRNLKWRSGKGFAPDSFTKILSREDFEPFRDELALAKLEHPCRSSSRI